jgi:hypothetical protein
VLGGVQRQTIGGDVPVRFYFNLSTFLLKRRAYDNVISVTETFSDYRAIHTVMIPYLTYHSAAQRDHGRANGFGTAQSDDS